MKIGVISDTHVPERAPGVPAQALEAFRTVDMIIHAGDLVDLSVLQQLRAVCPTVKAVAGNMDPTSVAAQLPVKETIQAEGFKIAVMHGWGNPRQLVESLLRELKPEKPDVIVFGHSHLPTNEIREGILFFNPGSATDTVFAPYRSYGMLEIGKKITGKIFKIEDN